MKKTRTGNWNFLTPAALVLVLFGVFTGSAAYYFAATIPLIFLLYTSISRIPNDPISTSREIEPSDPMPGDRVDVTLEVENTSTRPLTDVRVIDGVPDRLGVRDGSPRKCTSLRSGETTEINYSITAKRGEDPFKPVNMKITALNQKTASKDFVHADGDTRVTCRIGLEDAPLRQETIEKVGNITTDQGGSGIEFHSLRDYRSTDPLKQVEWRHFAKTRELATKEFREQRSAKIVLIVDARSVTDVRGNEISPSGRELSFYAAKTVFDFLRNSPHSVGMTGLGMEYDEISEVTTASGVPWISPSSRGLEKKSREFFSAVDKDPLEGEDGEFYAEEIYGMIPPGAQVIIFSPVLDDALEPLAKTIRMHEHAVTVVTPDIAGEGTKGKDVEGLERKFRIARLKKYSEVIDWEGTEPLSITISKAVKRIKNAAGGSNY